MTFETARPQNDPARLLLLPALWLLGTMVAMSAQPQPPTAPIRFPPGVSVPQTVRVGGKLLRYRANAGWLPVLNRASHVIAEMSYVSFTLDGQNGARRPVTFALNGGPGSASAGLALGIGPKTITMGVQGTGPSSPLDWHDNPATWLPFTDLVFLDPVGTGYSRSLLSPKRTARAFYGTAQDVNYLSRVIFDWLKLNGRMDSPKYLVGESYGGFRTPMMVENLAFRGVGICGLILVSPYLDMSIETATGVATESLSPMSYVIDLPSMAAANYEREGKTLTPELMRGVEEYALGPYVTALLEGTSDPVGFERMVKRVAQYTGMPEATVRKLGGRLSQSVFLRDVFRNDGRIGSRYDIDWTSPDPYPWSEEPKGEDMVISQLSLEGAAITDFTGRVLGWTPPEQYWNFNPKIPAEWDFGPRSPQTLAPAATQSFGAIRRSLALDPHFSVLMANGYTDLACPFMMSRLAAYQIPPAVKGNRLELKVYPGGHEFYSRPRSALAFMHDVEALYRARP
ncbi:MAG: S10 family peptidase [Steroidobacteraceae bacterium]